MLANTLIGFVDNLWATKVCDFTHPTGWSFQPHPETTMRRVSVLPEIHILEIFVSCGTQPTGSHTMLSGPPQ